MWVPEKELEPRPPAIEDIARCPFTKHPLARFEGPIEVMVMKEVELPIPERWRRRELGLPETELKWVPEKVRIPPGILVFHDEKEDCPGKCRFYEVRDFKLVGMSYGELVERIRREIARVARPIVPTPAPPRAPPPPFIGYVPALAPPKFEVPLEDRAEFYSWLERIEGGVKLFELSDDEQKRRLYENWKKLVKGRR